MPHSKDVLRRWKEAGLCDQCGQEPAPGKAKCEHHLAINRRASKNYRPPSDESRRYYREYRSRIRYEVLDALGGRCICCGQTEKRYLTLDHTNNDGRDHRKALMGSSSYAGIGFLRKLRTLGGDYSMLQVLCANCHLAKTYFGGCPTH